MQFSKRGKHFGIYGLGAVFVAHRLGVNIIKITGIKEHWRFVVIDEFKAAAVLVMNPAIIRKMRKGSA